MYTALIILHAITCLLLIGVVLIQSSKGAGLSGVFAADGGDSFMGAGTGNFLTKLTSVLAVVFMVTASSLAFLSVKRQRSVMADKKAPVVTEAQKQAFQQQIAKKMQEIKEQSEKASPEEVTQPLVSEPKAAPTVDDMIKQEEAFSTAVPETKLPEADEIAEVSMPEADTAEENAAVAAQVKEIEAKQQDVPQTVDSEQDVSVSVQQEKEIEAALAKAQTDKEAVGAVATEGKTE